MQQLEVTAPQPHRSSPEQIDSDQEDDQPCYQQYPDDSPYVIHQSFKEFFAELELPEGVKEEGEYWRFWRSDYRWTHLPEWKDITREWVPCKPKPTYDITKRQPAALGQDPYEELSAREDVLLQQQRMPPAEQVTLAEGVSARTSRKGAMVTYVKGYGSLVRRGPEYFQDLPLTSRRAASPAPETSSSSTAAGSSARLANNSTKVCSREIALEAVWGSSNCEPATVTAACNGIDYRHHNSSGSLPSATWQSDCNIAACRNSSQHGTNFSMNSGDGDNGNYSGFAEPHPYDPYIQDPQLLLDPKMFASVYSVWKDKQYSKLQAKLQESADYIACIEEHLELDDPENVVLQQLHQEQQRQQYDPQRMSDPGLSPPGTWCRGTGVGPCDDITCIRCARMQQTLQQATAAVRKEQKRRHLIDTYHPRMLWHRVKAGHARRRAQVFMGRWNRLLLEARLAEQLAELRFMLYLETKKPLVCF